MLVPEVIRDQLHEKLTIVFLDHERIAGRRRKRLLCDESKLAPIPLSETRRQSILPSGKRRAAMLRDPGSCLRRPALHAAAARQHDDAARGPFELFEQVIDIAV